MSPNVDERRPKGPEPEIDAEWIAREDEDRESQEAREEAPKVVAHVSRRIVTAFGMERLVEAGLVIVTDESEGP